VRYRRSAIGFLWTMLQPLLLLLMMMMVLQVVFSSIFRFKLDFGNYPVYALAGLLFWNFFSSIPVQHFTATAGPRLEGRRPHGARGSSSR
jgi:ABC-type polysaccharide/polyol phosphate export permease